MFRKSYSGGRSGAAPKREGRPARPSFRVGSSDGRGKPFAGRGRPSAGRGRPTSRRRKFDQSIDVNLFINKAVVAAEEVPYTPIHTFNDFNLDSRIVSNIAKKGYLSPTPIQDQTIPHIMVGTDVVGIANTGTGKTGAFLLPLIHKVLKNPNERVLIVVPTRELALQIHTELRDFSPGLRIFGVCCVGGMNIGPQIRELRRQNHFVIGTPGRLKDLMERKVLSLANVSTVVLDEADRMLDMGFIHDMRFLLSHMPTERHTLFFSATMSREIETLIHEFLKTPVSISVKTRSTATAVDQDVIRLERGQEKIDALYDLLIQPDYGKVLIFGKTKHGVEKLALVLRKRGIKAESIHGNKSQSQRQRSLDLFKTGRVQVLTATDVAARGLDIVGVSHVINYDLPATYDDYVHRIGRTGRGTAAGKALTFIS